MRLTPREIDKLILHNAGFLAQKRYARGLALNYPETVSLLAAQLLEFIRDGESVADLMDKGKRILGLNDVMPGVAEMVHDVQVEGTFPDGTKLVTVHDPICRAKGDPELALYGSGLSRSAAPKGRGGKAELSPGGVTAAKNTISLNEGRETVRLTVTNLGDRPVQVGSHYPFFEVNPELQFDRTKAYGMRLNIASGTAVRFEPGEAKKIELVEIAGKKEVYGGNGLIDGPATPDRLEAAMARVEEGGFQHKPSR